MKCKYKSNEIKEVLWMNVKECYESMKLNDCM